MYLTILSRNWEYHPTESYFCNLSEKKFWTFDCEFPRQTKTYFISFRLAV